MIHRDRRGMVDTRIALVASQTCQTLVCCLGEERAERGAKAICEMQAMYSNRTIASSNPASSSIFPLLCLSSLLDKHQEPMHCTIHDYPKDMQRARRDYDHRDRQETTEKCVMLRNASLDACTAERVDRVDRVECHCRSTAAHHAWDVFYLTLT
jgi:hypothetical protein